MLREISLVEAVERIEKGEQVLCLRQIKGCTGWKNMLPHDLNEALKGIICFAEYDVEDVTEEPKPKKPRKPRVLVDREKVIALYASGWKLNHIAEEVGCHPNTVRIIIEEAKSRLDAEEADK